MKKEKKEKEMKEKKEGESGKVSPAEVKRCSELVKRIKNETSKIVIGQEEVIDGIICAILCEGHVLVEGVPGIAKTLLIRTISEVTGCESKRVQFTVDLLPTDIIGITTYTPGKGFEIVKGPIFANFIIADEINRSPPKTQSALLEAMQERQVTIGTASFPLPRPFFVMANENPLETSGVYPLPEAQIDRFLFKLIMGYPTMSDEDLIMQSNITLKKFEDFELKAVTSPAEIIAMQKLTKRVYLDKKIRKYILDIINASRNKDFENANYIEWGASPRASIGLFLASKARALMEGRNFVTPKDVKSVVYGILRHRIVLSYKARAQGITSEKIIQEILNRIKAP